MISNYIKSSLRTQGVHGSPRRGLSETGANLQTSVKKFQLCFTSVAEICMTRFSLLSKHSYGAFLIMIQESRPVKLLLSDFQSDSETRTAPQALCHRQRLVGDYRQPACFRTITSHSTQEPPKNIFHSCQQWQKAPKYCWVTTATDVAHVSIPGKATNVCRKHCLKMCQFPSLTNSSACFQIQRSSFSSSRDQFDRQILLIPKCVISLCDHLPFYLECWLESDPGANRNININFLKPLISENWNRQTRLLIYTLSHSVQMLETLTVPSTMYTCHSWQW